MVARYMNNNDVILLEQLVHRAYGLAFKDIEYQ